MDWADLFSIPPWPESSPSRREVKPMSFLETLSYDAPDSYESTLASILDTDFPLQSSPSRRGVLSRSSSGRSVFGDSRSVFGDNTSVFTDSRNLFGDSRNLFDDSTNVFTDSKDLFDDSRNLFGDSLENFSSGLRYTPSDRTGSMSDGDLPYAPTGSRLRYAPSDLTSAASDRTGSVSDGEPYDALEARSLSCAPAEARSLSCAPEARSLSCAPEARSLSCAPEARSLPCAPEAERAGEEGQQQKGDVQQQSADEEEQGSAGGEEQQQNADEERSAGEGEQEEQANEGRSYTEIIFPLMPGLLLPEPSFAFVPPSPSFVPPSPSILPPSPSILPPSPRIDAPSPSIVPPSPSISPPSPSILPPYPSVDVPARAQSPASALAPLARFYGCFPDTTNSASLDVPYHAPCDQPYPAAGDSSDHANGDQPYSAPCDLSYPAACDQPSRGEDAATHQSTAVHHDAASDVEYYEGARDGAAPRGAQPTTPRATSTATDAENAQTKPRRKARKSKGRARAAVDDVIEQTAPRATAPHAPAAASAFHSAAHASHSASPASHSAAHDDSPEYAEVIEQRRRAKRERKARGMNGRAVIDSAVDAAVAIAASVPDFAPGPRSAARVQPVAARGQTAVNASAHAQAAATVRAQEPAHAQGVTLSQADIVSASASAALSAQQASRKAQDNAFGSRLQQAPVETSGAAAPPTAPMVVNSSVPAPARATAAPMASRVPNALPPAHVFPTAPIPAAAPSAAAYAPHSALTSASMDATTSSRPLAPPAPASRGSCTPAMLWQALMKGELTSEEMQAHLRPNVKRLPILEGARAEVLRSVTLSEGVPMAPPSLGSLGMGASSDSMGHPAGSSSSSPRGMKRKHGHDAQPEDPNWTRCQWTHFDAKNQPMGPCTHFYNKKSDRAALRENVREHMRKMEPNRCDGIFCQWPHDCKRNNQYFVDLYAVVDHIVNIILGTERVRR